MASVLEIVAPIFGLLLIGFALAKLRILSHAVDIGLSEYVFVLAIPCVLIKTIASATFPDQQPWGYWISYFVGAAVVWATASFVARKILLRKQQEAVIFGFSAATANTAMVGIPLITQAVGPESGTPLALLLSVHLPIMTVVASLFLEGATSAGFRQAGRNIAKVFATHPILIAIYIGTILNSTHLVLPSFAASIINLIAMSATPCSLIAIGVALHRHNLKGEVFPAAVISFLKLIIHPMIVFILSKYVFSMPAAWSAVCVLFAACPSGVNAYLLAGRIGAGERVASAALSLSTLMAVLSMIFWIYVVTIWA